MREVRPRLPALIERSDLESPRKRRIGQLISLAAWLVWIYLFTPLIALLGWAMGVQLFEEHILDDPLGTLKTVQIYAGVIGIAGVVFIGWAGYNWFRFHNLERRRAPPPVGTHELARHFGITPEQAETVERDRVVTVHFNEDAEIIGIDPGPRHDARVQTGG